MANRRDRVGAAGGRAARSGFRRRFSRVEAILDANAGRYEQAEARYRRAIELEPENADGYRRLGMVLMRRGHTDEALAEYRARRLRSIPAITGFIRSWALLMQGSAATMTKAAKYLEKEAEIGSHGDKRPLRPWCEV